LLKPGLYLVEHRRCPEEIIDYCNKIVYKNNLKSTFKFDEIKKPYHKYPWIMIDVEGTTLPQGGSKRNSDEADAIRKILSELKKSFGEDIFKKTAVITPFRAQENVLLNKINK